MGRPRGTRRSPLSKHRTFALASTHTGTEAEGKGEAPVARDARVEAPLSLQLLAACHKGDPESMTTLGKAPTLPLVHAANRRACMYRGQRILHDTG